MPNLQDHVKKIAASLKAWEQQIARDIVAVEAEQFHEKNFRDEGFTDASLQKWPARKPPRQNKTKPTPPDKNKGRALLVQSSTLKGHALKGRTLSSAVEFVMPLDYMKVHNEGGKAGRGKGFTMPKRQYIGESAYLDKRIEEKARRFLDEQLKNL
jgi:phage gpG-like protein